MKNFTFFVPLKNNIRPTVNRRSTDGPSKEHYSRVILKYVAIIPLLLTLACGNVCGAITCKSITSSSGEVYLVTPANCYSWYNSGNGWVTNGSGGAVTANDYFTSKSGSNNTNYINPETETSGTKGTGSGITIKTADNRSARFYFTGAIKASAFIAITGSGRTATITVYKVSDNTSVGSATTSSYGSSGPYEKIEVTGLSSSENYYAKVTATNDLCLYAVKFFAPAAAGTTWYVKGGWNSWGTTDNLKGSGTEISATINITTAGSYAFKIWNDSGGDGTWYGNGGKIGCNVSGWVFDTSSGDCSFFASETGNYTFTFNTSTKALSVTYPTAQGKYYYKNTNSWGSVAVYRYVSSINNGWPGTIVTETETICGDTYYVTYADPGTTLIFNNNNGGSQTGNMTASGNAGKYVQGTESAWNTFPTYTVTYNGNTNTGGSVPTDSNSPYSCGSTVTVLGNTGSLVKTGYNFTGWNTASDGSGSDYAAAATFTISANTTLYAQWELIPTYDVTYDANSGGTGTTASQTGNLDGVQVTTRANGFTPDSGKKFKWWNTAANGSGEDFYPGEKVTIDGANVALYAQWETVASNQEYWTPIGVASASTGKAISITEGDMSLSSGGATDAADINVDLTAGATTVSKYSSTAKHAKVLAIKNDDKYIQVNFTDGSPINKLWLGTTTNNTAKKNLVVLYSTTADFSTGEYEKVTVMVNGYEQTSKAVFDFSPSTADKYLYARIYRKISTAVYSQTGGDGATARIYSIKAQKGTVCTAPSALMAASPAAKGITLSVTDANDVNDYEFYVSTSSSAPDAEDDATHSVNSAKSLTITNLVAGTTYYAWARSKCSESNKSGWTALTGNTFTTSTVTVTHTLSNVTKTSGATSAGGSDYTAVFAAVSGYSLPSPVVTIDGNAATSGTDYTWTAGTGTITIPASKINGNIVITMSSPATAPTSVDISGTYHYYPGETISLTAEATGGNGPKTYQWYKGGTDDEDEIDGATSATYSRATCVVGDAGSYYCKVTCGGSASLTSGAYNVKIMQFVLKNSSGVEISRTPLNKVDATHAAVILNLTGGTTYKFRITDGCGNYYGNSGTMTNGNSTDWYMNADADCGMTTGLKTANYTFNITLGDLGNDMQVTAVYPGGDQAADKIIYWDNSVLNWTAGKQWYRIGKSTHHSKTQMTLVPGTANLYKVTTAEYTGFEYWHIANNEGEGTGNLFWTKDNDPATDEEITHAMEFEGAPVTLDAVTVTPTESHATGETSDNNNCEFYTHTTISGMKTDRVTISDYSNGTITVNYTNTSDVASTLTSGYADLAHTVVLTSITAVPNTGYDASAITINGGAYSANYVVTGATTIAANFTLKTTTITIDANTANHGSTTPGTVTATYGTALPVFSAATGASGWRLTGYYTAATAGTKIINAEGTLVRNTTYATDESTPKWKYETSTLTLYPQYEQLFTVTYDYQGATGGSGTASETAASVTLPTPTKTNYEFQGWYTSAGTKAGDGGDTYIPTADITLHALWHADCVGGGGGGTLFSQNFNSATEVAFAVSTARAYTVASADNNIVGSTVASQFTSITCASQSNSGIAINSSTGANSHSATGIFQAYKKTGSGAYWSVTKTTDFAGTAPTAVKIGMDIWFNNLSSGSEQGVSFAVGDDFTDGLKGSSIQTSSNVHSGFNITDNSSPKLAQYGSTTSIYATALTQSTWLSIVWVVNNSGVALTYDNPTGSGTSTVNNDCYDIWLKTQAQGVASYTRVVSGQSATTGTKPLQNLHIGGHGGKQHEFMLDNVIVTDLTPAEGTCYYVRYSGNGAESGFITDETAHNAGANVTVLGNTGVSAYTKAGYTFMGWNTQADGEGTDYAAGSTISAIAADVTLYAQWESSASVYTLTWDANGGSDGSCTGTCTSGSVSSGTTLVAPEDPTLSNYTFDGWNTANDGSGSAPAATMPAANTTYYAAWKQTVTLSTGSQGSGDPKTPYIYLNGSALSDATVHTAAGYTLNGYYTAASDGTKVLNADGSLVSDVSGYTSNTGKWNRTDAAVTLHAQWRASAGSTCYEWDATETDASTGTNSYSGLYLTASSTISHQLNNSSATAYTCFDVSKASKVLTGHLNGTEISSVKFAASTSDASNNTFVIVFCSSTTFSTDNIIQVGDYDCTVKDVNKYDAAKTEFTVTAPSGTKSFALGRNVGDGSLSVSKTLKNSGSRYLYYVQACSVGGGTHTISYNNGGGTGSMSSHTGIADDGTQTLASNSFTAPTNYSFAGWVADVNVTIGGSTVTAGTLIANGATITNITSDIALTAKWSQSVTLNANTANHGSGDNGSATAYYNATALSAVTHTTPASGYKLLGYYTAATDGTKVLNSDGSFAGTDITDYITDGKWTQSTTSTPTLYAQYESAGALTWNLGVNTTASSLTTNSKSSSFTEISNANMTNAALEGGLSYDKSQKANLTGTISTTAAIDNDKYVKVTFQVASGYKFIPSKVSVKVQPVSTNKSVKLVLEDNASHSITYTTPSAKSAGSISTIEMTNGSSVEFTGTVTLKIYCYGATDKYRLGTPITIDGEIVETCATMPDYMSMSYTTTSFLPDADASDAPITIVGGANIDTYQWKYNTVNDRTSGEECGSNSASLTPVTDEDAATDVTRYYWCEMTNDDCGITIKSPAVAITVAAAKSDATVTWTNPASTPNYGGGGYTIKATVDQSAWNGNAADLVISAPAGVRIYNVSSGTDGSSRKYVQADFDVQTAFDRTTYASNIPFTVSAAATATYNAISDDHNVSYSACTGGAASEDYLPVDATHIDDTNCKGGWIYDGLGWIRYAHGSSSLNSGNVKSLAHNMGESSEITKYYKSSANHFGFYTEKAINGVRLYVYTSNSKVTVSGVYIGNSAYNTGTPSSGAVTYEATYYNDDDGLLGATNDGCTWVEIMFDNEVAAGKYGQINLSGNVNIAGMAFLSTSGGGATLNTYLQWSSSLADGATVNKNTTDAYFTYSASKITENTNTLGTITYSSSDPSVATVDATGKVAMVAAGTTTIKATLAASGCYKKAEVTYTLNVTEIPCEIAAGTLELTSGSATKCSSDNVTLTLTGFESGATIQWKDGDTDINNGGSYTIVTDGTTSTLTTNQPGTYSVIVTKDCVVRSNRITISNVSAEASATKIVDKWYVKNGRLTPDIELWSLSEGASLKSVAWSPDNATGLTCIESNGIICLEGKEPSSNESGADIVYTLTATITDACGDDHVESSKTITVTHQKNTDKHVLAFVVGNTEQKNKVYVAKGKGFTESIPSSQTTGVALYNTLAENFDVVATNVYSTDNEQKLKEYYSQFDILCVTDYPNTAVTGENSKSYVDALGALIDIRPILTMEAFVSKWTNWKAKGISGNPSSPTTRQYSMLLQCKDHEIFAGTELTKIGEGDEAMYRVDMVDNTLEDYATLDATYGAGAHEETKNYNYGGKPALQGFTFTKSMATDLLPIGQIDDGAGNNLQVGIERQRVVEARLLVLGINSYAMERLTDDGQTVVINALNYLMKKNAEDIADCSNYFVGGAEGDAENWHNADNWSGNAIPERTQRVRILAPCVIKNNASARVTAVTIVPSGKYNHGADDASGHLTIEAGGALIVDGRINATTAPYFTKTRATSANDLTIGADENRQGALILDNEDGETNATVEMYSASHWEIVAGKKKKYWSYVALPVQSGNVGEYFYNGFSYLYDETEGWIKKGMYAELHAFEGLGISMQTGNMEYFHGALAPTTTQEITLTKTPTAGNGENLIGNSWTAPIQIANFEASDFGDATANVMIYSTGKDDVKDNPTVVTATAENDGTVTAGQWVSIPIGLPGTDGYDGLAVIPAMQAFQVNTASETTLTLDYDKLVRDVNRATDNLTEKQHAPIRRAAKKNLDALMRVRVSGTKTRTDVWLLEDARFCNEFDNGWEASYVECDNRSAQLYAQSEIGNMSFLALPDLEGTVLGFAPSRDGNEYLFTFHYVGEETFYLNDLKLRQSALISEENSYAFTFEEGDINRFYISRTAIDAPEITTGVGNIRDGIKAQKILYHDKLYIIVNGRVYSATGAMVR